MAAVGLLWFSSERTVNPLASVRCRYLSGAMLDNAGEGAVCTRAGDNKPRTATVKTARTNQQDNIFVFIREISRNPCVRLNQKGRAKREEKGKKWGENLKNTNFPFHRSSALGANPLLQTRDGHQPGLAQTWFRLCEAGHQKSFQGFIHLN